MPSAQDSEVEAWLFSTWSCWLSARLGIAGRAAGELEPLPAVVPAGEQLVHVGLVAGVPDQRVARGVEHAVERDRELDDAEVRAQVPAGARDARDQLTADLGGQRGELRGVEKPQVGRGA